MKAEMTILFMILYSILIIAVFFYLTFKRATVKQHDIIKLEKERMRWSLITFPEADAISSLRKLESEIKEIEVDIIEAHRAPMEYADALMCLFDSAGRQKNPITPEEIFEAFAKKLEINKSRTWLKNPDNSYSHIKSNLT